MTSRWTRYLSACLVVLALTGSAIAAPETVIVIRHAEKGTEPAGDPSLTPAGAERAALLADLLANAHVTAIVTTQFRRTRETAAPLASKLKIAPVVIPVRPEAMAAHVPEVLAAISKLEGTILVVAHSDTAPAIVTGLTGVSVPKLCDSSYGHVFVVSPGSKSFVRLRYGAPDAKPAEGCL